MLNWQKTEEFTLEKLKTDEKSQFLKSQKFCLCKNVRHSENFNNFSSSFWKHHYFDSNH